MFIQDKSFANRLIGCADEIDRQIETTLHWIKYTEKNPISEAIEKISVIKAKKDIEDAARHSKMLRELAEKFS